MFPVNLNFVGNIFHDTPSCVDYYSKIYYDFVLQLVLFYWMKVLIIQIDSLFNKSNLNEASSKNYNKTVTPPLELILTSNILIIIWFGL